jgi:hypothetical protein
MVHVSNIASHNESQRKSYGGIGDFASQKPRKCQLIEGKEVEKILHWIKMGLNEWKWVEQVGLD